MPNKPHISQYLTTTKKNATASKLFRDFVRASDAVELLDPTGAIELVDNPSGSYTGVTGGGHGQGSKTVKITPHGCEIIEFYAANGLTHGMIAKRLGINIQSFNHKIRTQPEVAEALSHGKSENEYELHECLMGMARRGNVIAAIYLTKARHGWRDNDPVQGPTQNNVVIQLPASMSLEDLKRLADAGVTPMMLPSAIPEPSTTPVLEAEYETK